VGVGGEEDFVREAEIWIKLEKHPHIVPCLLVKTLAHVPCIFVEYMAGGSLADWIEDREHSLYRGGPTVALERILNLAIQMAWGLDHAHTRGLVHQDIKPANVLLTQEGIARITDFGLAQARFLGGEPILPSRRAGASVVVEGVGMMTMAYASPEQAAGKLLTRSTDLWSWAVSVLDLFVGAVARGYGPASADALANYLREGPTNPAVPPMPPGIVTLLRRCFQSDPAARPASMQEVATVLQVCYAEVVGTPYARTVLQSASTLADDLGNRAISLSALGKQEEALAAYEDILRLNPQDARTWMNKGVTLHALKRYEEALDAFEQALYLDPQDALTWRNKGLTLYDLKRYEEALRADEQALRLDQNLTDAWVDKGNTLRELKQYEEALAAYEQALLLDPQHARTWMDKGLALSDLKRYEEALAAYEQALRLDPLYALTWQNKGVALCGLKRHEEALGTFEQALRLNPNLTDVWMDKGNVLYDLQWYEEALAAYKQALRLNPQDAPIWMNKGNTLRQLQRYKEALAAHEQALRLDPNLTAAWVNKGNVLYNLKRYEEALAAYEQALRLDPNLTDVWRNKGSVLYNLKRYGKALAAYEQALRLNPQDALIEVPNRWGEGPDGCPLVVELRPHLERIFTDPHPPLPQRLTRDNCEFWEGAPPFYVREVLASAYLSHPDPNVRLTTLRLTKEIWAQKPVPHNLIDALADPSQDVRVATAQVLWDLSPEAKVESKVTFALACLRDEIERTGFFSTMTQLDFIHLSILSWTKQRR
jgi:tetratricopeptide (TPR) repeat protein